MNPRKAMKVEAIVFWFVIVALGVGQSLEVPYESGMTGARANSFCKEHGFDGAEQGFEMWYCWVLAPVDDVRYGTHGERITETHQMVPIGNALEWEVEAWDARKNRAQQHK